jgi:hypothetical protein
MPGARSPVRDEGAGRLTVNPALLVGRLVRTSPVEWTIRHPTDPATVARYGYDGRRGIYIDIEHEGAVVFRYDGREVDQGVRDVLEELVVFAFLGGADIEHATDWLVTPEQWRGARARAGDREAAAEWRRAG